MSSQIVLAAPPARAEGASAGRKKNDTKNLQSHASI